MNRTVLYILGAAVGGIASYTLLSAVMPHNANAGTPASTGKTTSGVGPIDYFKNLVTTTLGPVTGAPNTSDASHGSHDSGNIDVTTRTVYPDGSYRYQGETIVHNPDGSIRSSGSDMTFTSDVANDNASH